MMRSLGPKVKCTLQIDYPSRIFSRLIGQRRVRAFPLQRHRSSSTRQDGANGRHVDGAEAVEYSNTNLRDSNGSSSSSCTPSVAKDPPSGVAVPPLPEPQSQSDQGLNSSLAFPQQTVK